MDKTLGQIAAEADFGLPVSGDISNYERIAAAVVEEHERRSATVELRRFNDDALALIARWNEANRG